MTYTPPRVLSASEYSPNYDRDAISRIDRVFVGGTHCPDCVAYDMDAGWAIPKIRGVWQPRQHGEITVTLRQESRA